MALIDFPNAALIRGGDVNPGGGGITTSGSANESVLNSYGESDKAGQVGTVVAPGAVDTVGGHAIPWWVFLVGILVVWAFVDAKSEKDDLKEVKVGFANSFKVALFVLVWFTLFKWIAGVYVIPGLSAVVEAA